MGYMKKFTLVGILLLVAIVGGVLLLRMWALAPEPGLKVRVTRVKLETLEMAVTAFHTDFERWPRALGELTKNGTDTSYLVPGECDQDAWGHEFVFEPPDARRGYGRILSFGRDGKPGGTSYDADLEVRFPKKRNAAGVKP